MQNRFNLIDEPWIPVVDQGIVSLREIFTRTDLQSLGGNPIQKISLMKLLLAVSHAAITPKNKNEWTALGTDGLIKHVNAYLDQWHDSFYLYGDKPFLQIPAISKAAIQSYGAVNPEISTGNTTVLTQSQIDVPLKDNEKALLLLTLMAFALSGKKTDNSIVLTEGYSGKRNEKGKPSSSKTSPSMGFLGLLHSFILGKNIQESIWLNLLTTEQLEKINMFPKGIGAAPWEQMPAGEDCEIAKGLKQSLMGRLIPLCRFCLLTEKGIHYSEGIAHPGYKEGITDPSTAVNYNGKEPKALWADPEKRPWRELSALLSFLNESAPHGFQCWQLRLTIERIRESDLNLKVWTGGLRVSSNAGEQYVSGSNDFVESSVQIENEHLGSIWFLQLKTEMEELDNLAKTLYGRVIGFYKELMVSDPSETASQATALFWQLIERNFQDLLNCCDQSSESTQLRNRLRRLFAIHLKSSYDQFCPNQSARQLDAWAKFQPKFYKYLSNTKA